MCRNIKTLFNFDPPATDEEIRAAALAAEDGALALPLATDAFSHHTASHGVAAT